MQWLTSNLLLLAGIGGVCIGLAFFCIQKQGLRRWFYRIGLGMLALTGIGFINVMVSAPGGEQTVVQLPRPEPVVPESLELIDILQATWNADETADWAVAEVMAEVSRIAYQPPSEAKSEYTALGFETVETMTDASMLGYVLTVEDTAVVVFRGTDDPADWVANLDRFSVETKHGPVHRGFQAAYQPLALQVRAYIKQSKAKHLWVTGHSLGGALAVLCAYDLAENERFPIDGLITFGQPLVARPPLTNHINSLLSKKFVHYVNQSDIVPKIPPSFSHCGSLVWYKGDEIRRSKPRGLLMSAAPGDEDQELEFDEIEPLSESEFESLQKELLSEKAGPDFAPDGTPLMKGNVPFLRDHDIDLYLEWVRD